MFRYIICWFFLAGLICCNLNSKKEQQPANPSQGINADSLLRDFDKETDSIIKVKKGVALDSQFFDHNLFGKWAYVKIKLGNLYFYQLGDEKRSAQQFADLAETTIDVAGDSLFNVSLCNACLMHAYNQRHLHSQYFKAIQYCEKYLLNPYHEYVDDRYLSDIYKYLGSSFIRIGDKKSAMTYLVLAYNRNTAFKNYSSAAGNCADIATNFEEFGKLDSALFYTDKGLSFKFDYPKRRVALLVTKTNCLLELKRYAEAKACLTEAYSIAHGDMDILNDLYVPDARLRLQTGNNSGAVNLLLKAIAGKYQTDSTLKRREYGKIFNEIGDCFLQQGDLNNAQKYYSKSLWTVTDTDSSNIFSLPSASRIYPENTILEALDAKAEIFRILYKGIPDIKYLQTAINCYALSFEVERKLMQYFSYDESKLLMLKDSRQRSQKAIAICYQLYEMTRDNSWAEKAFQFAEKNKGFVLLESVKRNLASNNILQKDTLYQKTQSLQLQLAYTERTIAEITGDSARAKLLEQKNKLENDLLFANTALSRQSSAYKAVMQKEDSVSTGILSSKLLNEHTGLVEFFSADSSTYAFVLGKDQPIQFIEYKSSLSSHIDSLLGYFKTATAISNDPMNYQRLAFSLYKELGLATFDKAWKDLIIIPDGKLSFVPFDALVTSASFSRSLQQAPWFIEKCNIVYGYSALILLTQKNNNSTDADNISVFAPVFDNSQNGQKPLLFSQQEAEAVKHNKNNHVFMKDQASLANFRKQFLQPGILHIATHAYADTAGNNDPRIEFIDSSLLLNELYAMHTDASLIVLSACETGIGKVNTSEGPMSLARGFYYAGAKNVITSYWSVDDKTTANLFNNFYKILPGSTSSTALCEAKRSFIKNTTASYASPYYWAGFVHFGMPKEKGGRGWWWWLLVLPLGLLIYYGIKSKKL